MNRITKLVRELRKNQTPSEALLWGKLRNRKLNNHKFLRQHPIIYGSDHLNNPLFFILDFYCSTKKLAIELDGSIHNNQKEEDASRDKILTSLGITVIRFRNNDLVNMEEVKSKIEFYLDNKAE
ncbi:MAG: endonuclease domain-containing protein [Flavobacteriales bacterium]|nr:endonuclease domain-containing protein [Flavobacteriales bacterium]